MRLCNTILDSIGVISARLARLECGLIWSCLCVAKLRGCLVVEWFPWIQNPFHYIVHLVGGALFNPFCMD